MKKLSKKEKALKRAEKIYNEYSAQLKLEGDVDEQLSQVVDQACKVKEEIEEKTKEIVENGYDDISYIIPIDKKTWNEFVTLTFKKNTGKINDKALEKFEQSLKDNRYMTGLRQSFYDSYLCGDELELADEDEEYNNPATSENTDVIKMLEKYSAIKEYINSTLKGNLKILSDCAFYLSNGELSSSQFGKIVEWEFTKNSTDLKKPSKSLKLYREFIEMAALMNKYGFEDHLKDLSDRFNVDLDKNTGELKTNLNFVFNALDEDDVDE